VAEPVPEIVDLDLDPFAPKSAGPVKVTVQADNAAEVWMTVDDGGEVALEPVGDEGTEFVGEIAVLGESWNGLHTVSAVARAGELESLPWEEMFTVTAPAAGTEAWKKKSTLTPSYGNAVAVDAQGEVYELFTESGNAGARCHVRRRDAQGDSCVAAGHGRRSPPGCTASARTSRSPRTGRCGCWSTRRPRTSGGGNSSTWTRMGPCWTVRRSPAT
jgi:hypothetical protein